jgi:hypothetical protein
MENAMIVGKYLTEQLTKLAEKYAFYTKMFFFNI